MSAPYPRGAIAVSLRKSVPPTPATPQLSAALSADGRRRDQGNVGVPSSCVARSSFHRAYDVSGTGAASIACSARRTLSTQIVRCEAVDSRANCNGDCDWPASVTRVPAVRIERHENRVQAALRTVCLPRGDRDRVSISCADTVRLRRQTCIGNCNPEHVRSHDLRLDFSAMKLPMDGTIHC